MKTSCFRIALTTASLLLAANLAFAVEVKVATPDVKGAAKATGDSAKAAADSAKTGAKGVVADTKASAAATKDAAKGTAADTKAAAKAKLVDINTATEAEMKAVPGIGDAYAAKIIAGRPYAKKDQLKSRNILPAPVYEKTKDLIIAKQPPKPAAAKKK
ncbi:MAG: helix-hairpin-helix domain-containing protein [Geobacteraceae bacterium]|nr:helix-hairpin-helix domain-containing protein [Geobacteraceae bacterium]